MGNVGVEFQNGNGWSGGLDRTGPSVDLPARAAWRPTLRTERGRVGHPLL